MPPPSRSLYVRLDSPLRRGAVLHGNTAESAAADLIDIVLGQHHPHRAALDFYLGLGSTGVPASTALNVPGTTPGRVYWLVERVRATGRTAIVPPLAWPALSQVSDDPVATARYRRIAVLLALPPLALAGGQPHWWSSQVGQAARTGIRVLAAAGPLTLAEISAAVTRSRRHYTGDVPDWSLSAALARRRAHIEPSTGRWVTRELPSARDAAFVLAAAASVREVHTRKQIHQLLIDAGYPSSTAAAAHIDIHPLLVRLDHDRYKVLGGRRDR